MPHPIGTDGFQELPDTATLALCHAVDPGRFRRGEAVVDAEPVELMCSCAPVAARLHRLKSRSVNALPLFVRIRL